jgi:DNA-binding response OmpR family regulator
MTTSALSRAVVTQPHNDNTGVGLRILLGEHDPEIRYLLTFILRADGHDVSEAADGAAMLDEIASLLIGGRPPFDLIISEQRLPFVPGLSILAGLRSSRRRTPFILIADEPLAEAAARRLGAIVLAIPLTVDALRGAVSQGRVASEVCSSTLR